MRLLITRGYHFYILLVVGLWTRGILRSYCVDELTSTPIAWLIALGSLTKWLRGPPMRGRSARARDTTFVGPCVLNSPYIRYEDEGPKPIP